MEWDEQPDIIHASVAEMADALVLGSSPRWVRVQVSPGAPVELEKLEDVVFASTL